MSASFLPLLSVGQKSTKGYASQIINVSSISGLLKSASGGQFAYAASKEAVVQVNLPHLANIPERVVLNPTGLVEQGDGQGVPPPQDPGQPNRGPSSVHLVSRNNPDS